MTLTRRFVWLNLPGLLFAVAAIWVPYAFAVGLAYHGALLLLAIADALLGFTPGSIAVTRHVSPKLSLNEKAEVKLQIRNRSGRRLAIDVFDVVPETFRCESSRLSLSLPGFQELVREYPVTPMRRGSAKFGDVWLRVRCSMGLAGRRVRIPAAQEVGVYPNLEGIRRAELLGRKNLLAQIGIHRIRFKGQGSEFEQLRDYTRDDDYKRINWKATARRRKPITMEYQIERSQNIMLCLDAGHMMGSTVADMTKLDYAVNAAALMAHVALSSGDRVGLMVFSHKVVTYVPPQQGVKQMHRLIEGLYGVQPEETRVDYMALANFVAVNCKRRSLLAIFTDLVDTRQGQELLTMLRLMRGQHLPLCLTFRDTNVEKLARAWEPTVRGVYTQAVAQDLARERTQLLRDLTRQGAHVLDTLPEELSIQSVNKYLELKARQLL